MHAVKVLCSGAAERCGCTENSRGKLTPSGTADILEEAMLRKRNAVASRYAQVQGAGEGCLLSHLLTYLKICQPLSFGAGMGLVLLGAVGVERELFFSQAFPGRFTRRW